MEARENGRRETRLLIATITISVVMLLLLARFRFPEESAMQPAAAVPAPLERLAARATYDELAAIMADIERRITPSVVVVPILGERGETMYVPAVRVSPDRAIALLGPGERMTGGAGGETAVVIARDPARNLVVLQVASRPGDVAVPRAGSPRPGPRYVAVVDATSQGIAVRPVYVGRTDVFQDPRTGDSMLSIAAVQQTLPRGTAVFNLDAAFLGLALESAGLVTVQSAQTLVAAAEAASAATGLTGELGLDVQPLTPELARATGASGGLLVSYVNPTSATGQRVRPLDVIQAVDGLQINSVAALQQTVGSRRPGEQVSLTILREGKTLTEAVPVIAPWQPGAAAESGGLLLHTLSGTGTEVLSTEPGSPAARAGLRAGDIVVAIGTRRAPDSGELLKAYASTPPGEFLLLTIRRGTQHRIVALERS